MSESRSTSVSLDVYSSRLSNCQTVFPHKIVRPLGSFKIDHQAQLTHFLCDLIENNEDIEQFIGDNPKRATARFCLCFSASYPCEYCFEKGVRFQLKKGSITTQKQLQQIREKIKNIAGEEGETRKLAQLEKDIEKTEKK